MAEITIAFLFVLTFIVGYLYGQRSRESEVTQLRNYVRRLLLRV